jgi:hypothetical protein
MTSNKRSVPSSSNPKKLMRLQRTQQSKNAVELASTDLYNIDSNVSTDVNRDDNTAGSKGIAKDTETQPMKPSLGPGLEGKTINIFDYSDSALLSKPSKVTVSLELRVQIRSYTYWSSIQKLTT